MDLHLSGRVYVVTGGTRGLGRATADALVSEGARVVVSSRSPEHVEEAVRELGPTARGVPADLASPESAERLVATAREEFGRLDGALVSVGGPPTGRATTVTDEQWRAAFESVFLGAVRLARTVAGSLTDGGCIALVLSSSARSPLAGLTISNGLRPGLAMLVKDLADELGPRGVRTVGLLPGRIATDRLLAVEGGDPDARTRSEAEIPLRRYGEPAEFGRTAAFLLSPAASYLTGSLVAVDGGLLRAL